MSYALWLVQILLAVLFLCTGASKLVLPIELLTLQIPLPGVLVRFIGLCELLGALELILPGALQIRTELTPLAAAGLVTIMIGATMFTPPEQLEFALLPLGAGILAGLVAYGRWRLAPLHGSSQVAVPELTN